ncbi:hypothetical protein [Secundilactobacillus silagei]|uniref:hypothetical protein n=1 Tax=Secundilactobacillus silagei TaxID=1293415 RepID=UPI0006D2C6F4|nr:hypothetical protein [Secundilactobacillus silagei]
MNTNNDQSNDLQFNRPSIQDLVFSINPEFHSENNQKQEYQIMVSASSPKYDSQVEKKISKVTLTVTNKKNLDKKRRPSFYLASYHERRLLSQWIHCG